MKVFLQIVGMCLVASLTSSCAVRMESTQWIYRKDVKRDPNSNVGAVGACVIVEPTNPNVPMKEMQIFLRDSNGELALADLSLVPGNNLEMEYFWKSSTTLKFVIHRDNAPDIIMYLDCPSFPKK